MSVYLKAAMMVDSEYAYCSCYAVQVAAKRVDESAESYAALFSPRENDGTTDVWGREWGYNAKDCRVLALLFMHWHETMKD